MARSLFKMTKWYSLKLQSLIRARSSTLLTIRNEKWFISTTETGATQPVNSKTGKITVQNSMSNLLV